MVGTKRKMKILHVINPLLPGGAERMVVELAARMKQAGHDVSVLTLRAERTPLWRELEARGVAVAGLSQGLSNYHPLHAWRLMRAMRPYDVVHVHLFPAQYWGALAKWLSGYKGILVTTEHNTFNTRCKYRLTTWLDRLMYRAYQTIIGVSEPTTAFMRARVQGKVPVVTIENGIDVQRVTQGARLRSELLPDLPPDAFVVMQVGRFRPQKNQAFMLRVLTQLPPDVHGVFVGDGPCLESCRQLAARLNLSGRAHFLGYRPDASACLAAADVAVMPSLWESFGLSALEAMARGVPVLASDVEGLAQVVGHPDLLFKTDSPAELAKKVVTLRNHFEYRKNMSEFCRKRASVFDIVQTVDKHLALYEDLRKRNEAEA